MKKILILSLAAATLAINVSAQKLKRAEVPLEIRKSFEKQYPGTIAKWEKENGKYEAGFKKDGAAMSALFDANGTMTESETEIKIAALPANVLAYVKKYYKGKSIKEGAKITRADGTVNYEAEVGGKDLIFDENGKFIKEMKG
jgi:hypothetical protein